MSGYNATAAASGQAMSVSLPGGYTLSYTLTVSGGAVHSVTLPTWSGAYLGNNGHYTGVPGKPALYQTTSGSTTTASLTDIVVKDANGTAVDGYALVGADAESTDAGEYIKWGSNTVLSSLTATATTTGLGNACAGGYTGVGSTAVTCTGSGSSTKTGTAVLSADDPSAFTQTMKGSGIQAVAFGVLVSNIQLNKTVVGGFAGDSFGVTVASDSGSVLGSANTSGGSSASTGQVTVLTGPDGATYRLSETATSGTLADYTDNWSCTRNGAADPSLPSGDAGARATVDVGIGDFINCTITNTSVPASLSLIKSGTVNDVNGDGLTDVGDTIAYSFDVTNTGDLTMGSVAVSDSKVGPVSCPSPSLAPGSTETCTASPYTVTAADVSNGSVDNTATATGIPSGTGAIISSAPSSVSTPTTAPAPALTLEKTASVTAVTNAAPGIAYTFHVVNTGNVAVDGVAIDESGFGGAGSVAPTCPDADLAPGADETCTATYSAEAADFTNGSIVNSATATGTPVGGSAPVSSAASEVTVVTNVSPTLQISNAIASIDGGTATPTAAGQVISYSYTVSNTGVTPVTGVGLAVTGFDGSGTAPVFTCSADTLAGGATTVCTATYTVTQTDIDNGSVRLSADAGGSIGGSTISSEPVAVNATADQSPSLSLQKSSDVAGASVGEGITYSFTVTNTGNVTIEDSHVDDSGFNGSGHLSDVACPGDLSALAPGATETCTATYTVTADDIANGPLANTATADGTAIGVGPVSSAPSTVDVAMLTPSIALTKTADPTAVSAAGTTIDYSYDVTNSGGTELTAVTVTENSFTGLGTTPSPSCPDTTLAAGASETCTATYQLTQSEIDTGTAIENTATASGTPPFNAATVTSPLSSATVAIDQAPALAVTDQISGADDTTGQTVDITYNVVNTGDVTVTDPVIHPTSFSGGNSAPPVTCPAGTISLEPGDAIQCATAATITAAESASGQLTETVDASGTIPDGRTLTSGKETAEVPLAGATSGPTPPSGSSSTGSATSTANSTGIPNDLAPTGSDILPPLAAAGAFLAAGAVLLTIATTRRRRRRF
jgi:Domain of unknown function DUF11